MELVTGHSYSNDAKVIAEEATAGFTGNPGTVLFFSPVSVFFDLTKLLQDRFTGAKVYGVSTNFSFFENRTVMPDVSPGTVVIGFGDGFDCSGGVIEEIISHPIEFAPAIRRCIEEVGEENTVCLTFTTAFQGAEELVLDSIASVIGDRPIPVAGSSAGHEKWERNTYISANGEVFSSASLFLFVHNKNGRIATIKQDMFEPRRTVFTATSVDLKRRIIYELDGVPAAMQLAKHLHYELYELNDHLNDFGLGRIVGDQIYTTDIAKITREKGLEMFASVFGGTRLCLLERSKYNSCLSNLVARIRKTIPNPKFALYFNCMSLTKYYQEINWLNVFSVGIGTASEGFAGMSGYGEQLGRININKTLLVVAFE